MLHNYDSDFHSASQRIAQWLKTRGIEQVFGTLEPSSSATSSSSSSFSLWSSLQSAASGQSSTDMRASLSDYPSTSSGTGNSAYSSSLNSRMSESAISNSSSSSSSSSAAKAKNKRGRRNNDTDNSSYNQAVAEKFSSYSTVLYRFVDAWEIDALPLSMTSESAGWVGRQSYVPCHLPATRSSLNRNNSGSSSGTAAAAASSSSSGVPRNSGLLAACTFAESLRKELPGSDLLPSSSSSSSLLEVEEMRFLEVVARAFSASPDNDMSNSDDNSITSAEGDREEDEAKKVNEKAKQNAQLRKMCALDCAVLLLASGGLDMLLPGEQLNALATVVRHFLLSQTSFNFLTSIRC